MDTFSVEMMPKITCGACVCIGCSSGWGWMVPMAAWLSVVTRLGCPRSVTVMVVGAFKPRKHKSETSLRHEGCGGRTHQPGAAPEASSC